MVERGCRENGKRFSARPGQQRSILRKRTTHPFFRSLLFHFPAIILFLFYSRPIYIVSSIFFDPVIYNPAIDNIMDFTIFVRITYTWTIIISYALFYIIHDFIKHNVLTV